MPETQVVQYQFAHGKWTYYPGDVIDAETMEMRGLDAGALSRFRLRGALKTEAEVAAEAIAAQAAAPMEAPPAAEPEPGFDPAPEPQG